VESSSHVAEFSSHLVECSSHLAEFITIKQVFYGFLEGFSRFFLIFLDSFAVWCGFFVMVASKGN
jgi:hypothetical protein